MRSAILVASLATIASVWGAAPPAYTSSVAAPSSYPGSSLPPPASYPASSVPPPASYPASSVVSAPAAPTGYGGNATVPAYATGSAGGTQPSMPTGSPITPPTNGADAKKPLIGGILAVAGLLAAL